MKFKILTTFLILVLFSNFCIAKESCYKSSQKQE